MKLKDIFEELRYIAKRADIRIRHENGRFNSGYCILNNRKLILFNRTTPLETKTAVLARSLLNEDLEGIYIKPAIRDFIEKEKENVKEDTDQFKMDLGENEQSSN